MKRRAPKTVDPWLDLAEDAAQAEPESEADLERALTALARGNRLVVGPWRGEVGHEVVCWIPFPRWAGDRFGIDPGCVTAISRGGVAPWYEGVRSDYADEPRDGGTILSPELAWTVYEWYRSGRGGDPETRRPTDLRAISEAGGGPGDGRGVAAHPGRGA
jgi:hypothetical protein